MDWNAASTRYVEKEPTRTLAVRCSNGLMPGLSPIKVPV